MKVLIVNESSHRIPNKFIQSWVDSVVSEMRRRRVMSAAVAKKELTLVFLDKKAAEQINFEFRGKKYATDVLSFDSLEPDSLGELILCPEVLKRQAVEHKLSFQRELGYMVLHGILHLLGYDHELSEAEAAKMFSIQDAIFERL